MPLSPDELAQISAFLISRGVEEEDLPAAIRQLEQLAAAQPQDNEQAEPEQHLLSSFDIEGVAEGIRDGRFKKIVMVVGAGISVSAGIPDFRSPGTGLYDNLQRYDLPSPQDIFSIDFFKRKPHAFYHLAKELYPGSYAPTPTHYLLQLLHSKGVLLRCFTQNIDSLENLAGLPKDMIVAAHGNFDSAKCIETQQPVPVEEVREAILHGETGECGWQAMRERYGGLVKPDIVFFGEPLPRHFFARMQLDLPACDCLIVMGTSLQVQPFASIVNKVAPTVPRLLINREKVGERVPGLMGMLTNRTEGFDFGERNYRDALYLGDCDEGSRALAHACGWGHELEELCVSAYDALIAAGRVSLPMCYCHRGSCYARLAQRDRAEADLRHALALDPELEHAKRALAELAGEPSGDEIVEVETGKEGEKEKGAEQEPTPAPEPEPTVLEPASAPCQSSSAIVVPSLLDAALHISGLWVGTRTTVRGGQAAAQLAEPISWALCLHRSVSGAESLPTAFGACFAEGPAGILQAASGDNAAVCTLRGHWDTGSQRVELRQVFEGLDEPPEGSDDVTYTATLSAGADGSCMLVGSWISDRTASTAADSGGALSGTFSCTLQAVGDSTASGPSGLFLGEAVPDACFAGSVPRNPIKWVVASLPVPTTACTSVSSMSADGGTTEALLGCGYFDDSGDFADSAMLWYFLRGCYHTDGSLRFDKVYEKKTGGATVNYTGRVVVSHPDGADTLQGSWENSFEPPATRGKFGCRRESPHEGMLPPAC